MIFFLPCPDPNGGIGVGIAEILVGIWSIGTQGRKAGKGIAPSHIIGMKIHTLRVCRL